MPKIATPGCGGCCGVNYWSATGASARVGGGYTGNGLVCLRNTSKPATVLSTLAVISSAAALGIGVDLSDQYAFFIGCPNANMPPQQTFVIYYTYNNNAASLYRVNLDGTGLTTLAPTCDVYTQASMPIVLANLAVDTVNKMLFFSSGGSIWTCDYNGGSASQVVANYGTPGPGGNDVTILRIAVDGAAGALFWTDSTTSPTGVNLRTSSLSGAGMTTLISVSGSFQFGGMEADQTLQKIFYIDPATGHGKTLPYAGGTPTVLTNVFDGSNAYCLTLSPPNQALLNAGYYVSYGGVILANLTSGPYEEANFGR